MNTMKKTAANEIAIGGGLLGAGAGGYAGYKVSDMLGAERTTKILSSVGGALAGGAFGASLGAAGDKYIENFNANEPSGRTFWQRHGKELLGTGGALAGAGLGYGASKYLLNGEDGVESSELANILAGGVGGVLGLTGALALASDPRMGFKPTKLTKGLDDVRAGVLKGEIVRNGKKIPDYWRPTRKQLGIEDGDVNAFASAQEIAAHKPRAIEVLDEKERNFLDTSNQDRISEGTVSPYDVDTRQDPSKVKEFLKNHWGKATLGTAGLVGLPWAERGLSRVFKDQTASRAALAQRTVLEQQMEQTAENIAKATPADLPKLQADMTRLIAQRDVAQKAYESTRSRFGRFSHAITDKEKTLARGVYNKVKGWGPALKAIFSKIKLRHP